MQAHKFDNPKLGAYIHCVQKVVKFQNEAGELQVDNIKAKLKKDGHNDAVIQQVEEQCCHNKDTPEKTAVEFTKCSWNLLHPKKHH